VLIPEYGGVQDLFDRLVLVIPGQNRISQPDRIGKRKCIVATKSGLCLLLALEQPQYYENMGTLDRIKVLANRVQCFMTHRLTDDSGNLTNYTFGAAITIPITISKILRQ
jgi:hypothetical protein